MPASHAYGFIIDLIGCKVVLLLSGTHKFSFYELFLDVICIAKLTRKIKVYVKHKPEHILEKGMEWVRVWFMIEYKF